MPSEEELFASMDALLDGGAAAAAAGGAGPAA